MNIPWGLKFKLIFHLHKLSIKRTYLSNEWRAFMISENLHENKVKIKEIFNNSSDLVLYEFQTLGDDRAMVVYINGFTDKETLNQKILKPLMKELISPLDIRSIVSISGMEETNNMDDILMAINSGDVVLFHEGLGICYLFNLASYEKRQIEQSQNEQVLKGPKETFVEDIGVNKTLIRRKIRNNNLVFEDMVFGRETNTKVSLVYINGIVNEDILAELKSRLKEIQIDTILDIGYIEEYIDDAPRTMINTIYNTEKPDVVAGKILEGRIGILCDGAPSVSTVPSIFTENLMVSEDYYLKPSQATFLRIIRIISLFTSINLAGIYIALTNFHQEMIPTELLISMARQREGVPLSSFLEAISMMIFFELLKEAGLRLPKPVGQTASIVGGLVIGQAAVDANLVSAVMVIVVSASGITEFVNPQLKQMIIFNRFAMFVFGAAFGLYGLVCGMLILIFHLVSIRSFGVPYLYPIAPYDKEGMKDVIWRAPIRKMNYRPKYIASKYSRKRSK